METTTKLQKISQFPSASEMLVTIKNLEQRIAAMERKIASQIAAQPPSSGLLDKFKEIMK